MTGICGRIRNRSECCKIMRSRPDPIHNFFLFISLTKVYSEAARAGRSRRTYDTRSLLAAIILQCTVTVFSISLSISYDTMQAVLILQCSRRTYETMLAIIILQQGCGSAFTLCGSGSSSFSECGSGSRSGSRSRSSLTKFEENKS